MPGTSAPATAHPYRWAVLAGVWLAYFCLGMAAVTLAPLVGVISDELGLSLSRMGTVLGGWQLTFVAFAVPCAVLLERLGPRRAILMTFAIFATSVALRATATGYVSLLLAVMIFGLGAPMISIGAPKLISQWFDGRDRGFAMGIYISGPFLGNITGLALTNGVMMPALSGNWRAVMLVYAGLVVVGGLAWFAITSHAAYRAGERRLAAMPREAQLETFRRLLALPAVRVVLALALGIFFFNHSLNNWLPEMLRSRGMSAAASGYWASIPTALAILSALTIPRLAMPGRRKRILLVLFLAATSATLMLHAAPGPMLVSGLIFQGLARGAMMTVTILILLDIPGVGLQRAGLAGGLFFSMAELGGVLGPTCVGLVSDAFGFDAALNLLSGICLALVGLLLILGKDGT